MLTISSIFLFSVEVLTMRRSQAPSSKLKILPDLSKKSHDNNSGIPISENNSQTLRTTESVLSLLTNTDCSVGDRYESLQLNITKNKDSIGYETEEQNKISDNFSESPQRVNEKSSQMVQPFRVFNVVYGKLTKKKHRTWEGDGILEIGSKYLTLKDETGKVLGTMPCPKARKLEEGERIFICSKEVELVGLANEDCDTNDKNKTGNMVMPNLAKETLIKRKFQCFGKKYTLPKINYSSGIALPEPSAEHQWCFNKNNLPVTPVYIDPTLSNKLRQHQVNGVTFLYECIMGFKDKSCTGAILADEMGLGKTLQCIALIWTLLKQGPYGSQPILQKVLIVTPSSLTMNWHNEFIKWLGRVKLTPFVVNQKNKPSKMTGPIMIISYEMLMRYIEDVEKHHFDLLICDEGHRLKNNNIRTTQILCQLNCPRRILLSGTPIQNDLQEFFALIDFVNPNVLGSASEFRRKFEEPILCARQPNADEDVITRGKESAQELKRITSKFLLRRTRDLLHNYLPPRHESVVFCKITDVQKKLYNSLIDSFSSVKENILGLSEGFAHLELITSLKKICNHPSLWLKDNEKQNCFGSESQPNCHPLKIPTLFKESRNFLGKLDTASAPAIETSGKMIVTVNFLTELCQSSPKEKVVLISNSTQTLDILGKVLNSIGYTTCRLDGSTPAAQRNEIVERFNNSFCRSFVFLLSSKAGGVGLNLTGASRLILFDSDWNPAIDLQAISRVWRDGQKYPVFIYRLLTAGTIEEKIYQRQVSKQGLCDGTIDPETSKSIKLSREELKDIFSLCFDEDNCLTHESLKCGCTGQGEIPVSEAEPEERDCQLTNPCHSSVKICELLHWEHHGPPFNSDFLSKLCLSQCEKQISFIFKSCKN